jgi:acyl carrier protein
VAPRTETEKILAEIWKELLNVDRVGTADNFFELGGDSIITIQVVSRARRKGIELKPKDIFIHQTVSSLSEAISEHRESKVIAEQGILTGESGLLPVQQWYLDDSEKKSIDHFNQSVLLSIDRSVTEEMLSEAVKELTSRHDALRFKYYNKKGQWHQEYTTEPGELVTLDLQNITEETLRDKIKEHSENYQRSLYIEKGQIARFVLIKTPRSEQQNRILIVIHHLAVDGVSWRILLDDLEILLTGLKENKGIELGQKTSSYRQWYEALKEYGQSRSVESQRSYWSRVTEYKTALPTDKEYTGVLRTKDIKTRPARLDTKKTQQLLQEVPKAYHTEINDILLCALGLTLSDWSSGKKVIIGMEGHGREHITDAIDTSRTVGWFTSLYPLMLEIPVIRELLDSIK